MKRTKKKIFIFIHQAILKGGVEKVFYDLVNNLPLEKYDITLLSVMGYLNGDFDSKLYPKRVKRHCLMWDDFSQTNCFKRISQKIHNRVFPKLFPLYLKLKRYDVAIAAQEGMYADFVLRKVKSDRKLLWIHNDIEKCHWTLSYFGSVEAEKQCYSRFDKVVCVSFAVKEKMEKVLGKMGNLTVCYNPIDTHKIDVMLKEPLPQRPGNRIWFVCVGRLAHQKGYDRLLNICIRLNQEGYKYDITILGDGDDREILSNMIERYSLFNVHLIGNQPNPFVYISQADWLLQPSRHEGFSLTLHEAAYCKTPIIATDFCGARELLGDSEYGIVVQNDEESIYHTLKLVLDDQSLHHKYKEAISQRSSFVNLEQRISAIRELL